MKRLALGLLLLAAPLQASELWWLDIVSYPAIPGWSVRHLQALQNLEADGPDADMLGRGQYATELTTADVKAIVAGLTRWSGGSEPPNVTVWRKQQQDRAHNATYSLDIVSRPGPDRHITFISTATGTLPPGRTCPSCYPVIAFQKQQMPLDESEVLELTDRLETWLSGEDPPDAIVWSKLVTR